jgi:hypothetical protein
MSATGIFLILSTCFTFTNGKYREKKTEKEEKQLQKLISNEKSRQEALKQQENIEI